MSDVIFTKEFFVNSSLIDGAWFNENDGTVVLDVHDTLYRYAGVTETDVVTLVNANSVGEHYNTVFKKAFGPAENLGHYDDVEYTWMPVIKRTPGDPKGLYYGDNTGTVSTTSANLNNDTREFSLAEPVKADDTEDDTQEFSLSFEDEAPDADSVADLEGVREIVITFTLDGFDKKYKYVSDATNVEDAIEDLHEYVGALGASGRVRKVVVKFV